MLVGSTQCVTTSSPLGAVKGSLHEGFTRLTDGKVVYLVVEPTSIPKRQVRFIGGRVMRASAPLRT